MERISKERREANRLREKIGSLLAEPRGWGQYEDQHDWLRKLSQREPAYIFTEREHDAVERISYMRTFFDGWGGFSVQELIADVRPSIANFGYDDELFLKAIKDETRLPRGDMRALVGLCRASGKDIPRLYRREDDAEAA